MLYKYGKRTREFSWRFYFFQSSFLSFWGVFNKTIIPLALVGYEKYYFQNESECFIGVSKHRETNESTRPTASCFYCFEVFEYPDETRSTSFGNNFS